MKRLFTLFLFICICLATFAQSNKIYYYNLYKETQKISSAKSYWEELRIVNKNYKKLEKAINRKGATIMAAEMEYQSTWSDIVRLQYLYEEHRLHKDISDSLLVWTNLKDVRKLNIPIIYILPIQGYNAASYPYETQMVLFTEDIVNILDKEELIACAAHELAHYYLKHQLAHIYSVKKKGKRNRFWANFGTALYAGVMAGANMYGASQGAEPLDIDYEKLTTTVGSVFDKQAENATIMYEFKYSREQEFEADIVALGFLSKAGIDCNKMISLFQKLEPYTSGEFSKTDDHPLTSERIKLLEYIIKKNSTE